MTFSTSNIIIETNNFNTKLNDTISIETMIDTTLIKTNLTSLST